MDEQLAAYRARKAKEREKGETNHSNPSTSLLQRFKTSFTGSNANQKMQSDDSETDGLIKQNESESSEPGRDKNVTKSHKYYDIEERLGNTESGQWKKNLLPKFLKLLLWAIIFGLFIEIGFGSVYFFLSLFYAIYASMRPGTRQEGAPSAYSVFNPNCERIDGTLTAEQFEREIRYGPGAASSD